MTALPDAPPAPDGSPRWLEYSPVDDLKPDPRNERFHADSDMDESLERFGYTEPVMLDERTGLLSSGHGRRELVLRARDAGEAPPEGIVVDGEGRWLVPVVRGWSTENDEEAFAYLVAANRLTEKSGWVAQALASGLQAVAETPRGLAGVGISTAELEALAAQAAAGLPGSGTAGGGEPQGPSLVDRFLVPPFSVFDARQGYWQERKRRWLALGIRSEDGRAPNLLNMSEQVTTGYGARMNSGAYGAQASVGDDGELIYEPSVGLTSIFDPVLCEIAYRWWCPEGGRVLDPFAGGSVRGITAALLERSYLGVDLSPEQIAANEKQADDILDPRGCRELVDWKLGDSESVVPALEAAEPFDLLFTCPPYFDLEQYSADPADLSNAADYPTFLAAYRRIIKASADRLADNRFAVIVVGDIRGSDGCYRGFVPDTIRAFEDAGLRFYNDISLITAVGSLALRAARIFGGARKVGKAHQNVLVFVKGEPQAAGDACAPVELADSAELFGQLVEDAAAAPADLPGWAQGFDLEPLRAVSGLFKEHDGDLPLGAFSAVKEATVAEWGKAGKLRAWSCEGQPVAALVSSSSERVRKAEDFRGDALSIPAGACVVSRLAFRPGWSDLIVEALKDESELWVELWQEHPADRALADALGLAWRATKVKASSELIGVYSRPGEAAWLPEPDGWALTRLDLAFDAAELRAEVEAAAVEWADHYAVYNKRNSWQAVALRGYGGDPSFIIKPAEMSKKWKAEHPDEMKWELADTPLAESLPKLGALVASLPGEKHRVRLMRLAPGNGELSRHADITDPDAGSRDGQLMRLHFPLATNSEVVFEGWCPSGERQTAHMAEGEVWWLDTRKPHTARNGGKTDRVHLVVDVEATPELRALAKHPAAAAPLPVAERVERPGIAVPWQL